MMRRKVIILLAAMIAVLSAAHWAGKLVTVMGHDYVYGLVPAFQLGLEANVPTWYASVQLFIAAMLLAGIALVERVQGRSPRAWLALGLIFVALSCDEVAGFHELTVRPTTELIQNEFLTFISWVVPVSLGIVLFGLVFVRFWWNLPVRTRAGMAVAGAFYVGGELGMELVTAAYGRVLFDGRVHGVFVWVEEAMGLAGTAIFIVVLLDHLRSLLPGRAQIREIVAPQSPGTRRSAPAG